MYIFRSRVLNEVATYVVATYVVAIRLPEMKGIWQQCSWHSKQGDTAKATASITAALKFY
jgi:hypothetical protein